MDEEGSSDKRGVESVVAELRATGIKV